MQNTVNSLQQFFICFGYWPFFFFCFTCVRSASVPLCCHRDAAPVNSTVRPTILFLSLCTRLNEAARISDAGCIVVWHQWPQSPAARFLLVWHRRATLTLRPNSTQLIRATQVTWRLGGVRNSITPVNYTPTRLRPVASIHEDKPVYFPPGFSWTRGDGYTSCNKRERRGLLVWHFSWSAAAN